MEEGGDNSRGKFFIITSVHANILSTIEKVSRRRIVIKSTSFVKGFDRSIFDYFFDVEFVLEKSKFPLGLSHLAHLRPREMEYKRHLANA